MKYIPQTSKSDVGYRNIASSESINSMQNNVLSDILNLFVKANKLEKEVSYIKESSNIENNYLSQSISKLNAVQDIILTNATYKNAYPSSMIADTPLGSYVDKTTLTVTAPTLKSTPKYCLYDDVLDEVFLPESLKVAVSPAPSDKIIDNDVYNCLRGDDKYYIRKVIDNSIEEAVLEYVIDLPEDIISSREVNSIILNTFPYKSCDVLSIYYTLYGDWNLIPSFNSHSLSEDETYLDNGISKTRRVINEAAPLRFDFRSVNAKRIKIVLRQRSFIELDGLKTFCFGIKELKILFNEYNRNTSSFKFKIDFSKSVIIKDIKPILNNIEEVESLSINHEFYYISQAGAEVKINTAMPFNLFGNTLVVKTSFNAEETTPSISKIQVFYE